MVARWVWVLSLCILADMAYISAFSARTKLHPKTTLNQNIPPILPASVSARKANLSPLTLDSSDGVDLLLFPQFRAKLRLNASSAAALEALPGIGETMAESMVRRREEKGPYRSLNELEDLPRWRKKTLEEIRGFLVLQGLSAVEPP